MVSKPRLLNRLFGVWIKRDCNFWSNFLRPMHTPLGDIQSEIQARGGWHKEQANWEGRVKTEEGKMEEGKKEGMEAWQGARAGSVPQMCPHHPGGNVLSGQERPPHTHTYIHSQAPSALILPPNGQDHPSNYTVYRDCGCQSQCQVFLRLCLAGSW